MKILLTLLFIIQVYFPAQSQYTKSLDGMSTFEIKKLLMTQTESEKSLEMIKKYNVSRGFSYVFFGSGIILLASQDSSNEKNAVLTGFYGGVSMIAGLITTIVAIERFKKAKNYYLNSTNGVQLRPLIRSNEYTSNIGLIQITD